MNIYNRLQRTEKLSRLLFEAITLLQSMPDSELNNFSQNYIIALMNEAKRLNDQAIKYMILLRQKGMK